MNVFTATGRLTGDATYRRGSDANATNTPDMNALGGSKPKLSYGRFNVAVDCPGRKEKTTFVTVVCFGKMADFIGNGLQQGRYLKGCAVEFDGPLQPLACYKDQQGVDHYYMEVWANFTYSHVHKNWNSETKSLNVQDQGNSYVQNQNNYGNNNVYGQESYGNGTSAGNPNNQRQNGAYGTGNPARTPSGNPNGQGQNSSYGTGVPTGNNGFSPSSQFETENSYPYENGFSPSGFDNLPDEMPPAPDYVDNVPNQSADGFQPATYNY